MSLEIIVQEIKLFGNLLISNNNINRNNNNRKQKPLKQQNQSIQKIDEQRMFRATLGNKTYTSTNTGFFISPTQLAFDQPFSLYYDNKSLQMHIQIFTPYHQQFNNSDLQTTLFAEFDLTDLSVIIGDRIQTTLYNIHDQAIGKLTALIQVFKQGPRFIQKVNSHILFQTVKQQKQRQIKASQASKNIKHLMVNNSLTNTLMTINYLQVKPLKQDTQIFNKDTFLLIRYGFSIKAYSRLIKVQSKQSVVFTDYLQFMKNQDVKFEFFFMFYDDLGNLTCKAKGEIKYIVFDQTINNHTITLFDKRSTIYGDLMVKFIQKQVQVVNINNKIQKKLKAQQQRALIAIDQFNRFKFESQNNNRILSQKLRQLQLKQLEQQQQKMKPIDPQQKKKRQQHTRFIQFLQKQVIKIQRQLKKKQLEEKKGERKQKYHHNTNTIATMEKSISNNNNRKQLNSSMGSTQFRQNTQKNSNNNMQASHKEIHQQQQLQM